MAELKKDGIRAAMSEGTERETLKRMRRHNPQQAAEDPNDSQQGWGHVPERDSVQPANAIIVREQSDRMIEILNAISTQEELNPDKELSASAFRDRVCEFLRAEQNGGR